MFGLDRPAMNQAFRAAYPWLGEAVLFRLDERPDPPSGPIADPLEPLLLWRRHVQGLVDHFGTST